MVAACLAYALPAPDLARPAGGSAGRLDPSFGKNGLVTAALANQYDYLTDTVFDSEGRIVATISAPSPGVVSQDMGLARFLPSGRLDAGFGGGGLVSVEFSELLHDYVPTATRANTADGASSLAIDEEGRLVAAGWTGSGSTTLAAVVRLLPSGELDTSFGDDGKVVLPFGPGDRPAIYGSAMAVEIDSAARLILGMRSGRGLTAARLDQDGALDHSFSGDGYAHVGVRGNVNSSAYLLDSMDRLLTVNSGTFATPRHFLDVAVQRLSPDGIPDQSFGPDGVRRIRGPRSDRFAAAQLDSRNRVVIASHHITNPGTRLRRGHLRIVRLRTGGSLDPAFGAKGKVVRRVGIATFTTALDIDHAGRLIVTNLTPSGRFNPDVALPRFRLQRLLPSGRIDRSFGRDGAFAGRFRKGWYPDPVAVTPEPGGSVLVAGDMRPVHDKRSRIGMVRYVPQPTCNGRRATIAGRRGQRVIQGTNRRDVIYGGLGPDWINGRGGCDLICGGPGADRLIGGSRFDRLFGDSGNDRLLDDGVDRLTGGPGRNLIYPG